MAIIDFERIGYRIKRYKVMPKEKDYSKDYFEEKIKIFALGKDFWSGHLTNVQYIYCMCLKYGLGIKIKERRCNLFVVCLIEPSSGSVIDMFVVIPNDS